MSTLFAQIQRVAQRHPQRTAVIDAGCALDYAALLARVDALAQQLRQQKIRSLALLADNSPAWIIVDLACLAAGVLNLPLPGFFSNAQLRHSLQSSAVDCILTDHPERIEQLLPAHTAPQTPLEGFSRFANPYAKTVWMPAGTWKITFTSGSTGEPKGVCLGVDQIGAVTQSLLAATATVNAQRHLSVLPYAVLLENIAGIYLPLLRGATIVAIASRVLGFNGARLEDSAQFLQALDQWQPHSLVALPQFLPLFTAAVRRGWKAPASLSFIAVGGSKVPPTWLRQARVAGLPVFEGYGLSECASVVALNTPQHDRPGSVGRVLPHCRVIIEDGEVAIHGNTFLGYLGQPELGTGKAVHSGDLGSLDKDGFLCISGRRKNLLVSSFGRNIAPEWPESELLAGGLFRHCVVFGDARPFCVALLEPHAELTQTEIATAVAAANRQLPEYARIARWFCPARPLESEANLLTSNGRPRRDAIAARYHRELERLYADSDGVNPHGLLSISG